jgi:hypothetical protein
MLQGKDEKDEEDGPANRFESAIAADPGQAESEHIGDVEKTGAALEGDRLPLV